MRRIVRVGKSCDVFRKWESVFRDMNRQRRRDWIAMQGEIQPVTPWQIVRNKRYKRPRSLLQILTSLTGCSNDGHWKRQSAQNGSVLYHLQDQQDQHPFLPSTFLRHFPGCRWKFGTEYFRHSNVFAIDFRTRQPLNLEIAVKNRAQTDRNGSVWRCRSCLLTSEH